MTEHTPDYRFESATDEDGRLLLHAVKSWQDGDAEREARLTVGEYPVDALRQLDLRDLQAVRDGRGLEAAMQYAESIAILNGTLDADRSDARLFVEGPDDPFTTGLEQFRARQDGFMADDTRPLDNPSPHLYDWQADWLAEADHKRALNAPLEGSAWFSATFEGGHIALLEPLDDAVNYAVVVQDVDPWTRELAVEKYWKQPEGYLGIASLTVEVYDPDDEDERARADADREALLAVYAERGLEGMMQQAERDAVSNKWMPASRPNASLFHAGPPDRFLSLGQLEAQIEPEIAPVVVGFDPDATQAMPALDPAGWDALLAAQPDEEPDYAPMPWQTLTRAVETPDGERLGAALFMLTYPDLPPETDLSTLKELSPDEQAATRTHLLELAHFASDTQAQAFEDTFRGVLVPGLLEGPELAPDVAMLEGLSGEWEERDYHDVVDNVIGRQTLVREADEWHPHQPYAEREEQEQFVYPSGNMDL
jgi:hypothetical protein